MRFVRFYLFSAVALLAVMYGRQPESRPAAVEHYAAISAWHQAAVPVEVRDSSSEYSSAALYANSIKPQKLTVAAFAPLSASQIVRKSGTTDLIPASITGAILRPHSLSPSSPRAPPVA